MQRLVFAALTSILAFAPHLARPQTTAVPDFVSYQGRATDTTGTPIANNTSTSRKMTFRIYDAPSAGTRLWSEEQMVTIASGDFSVLLGAGSPVTGEANTAALNALFTGAARFLSVTIDDGTANADPEVSPRQQLVTTPFAFRAKVAETVLNQSITADMIANGAVSTVQLGDIAVTDAKLATSAVTNLKLADNAVTSIKITNGTILTEDLANGAITTDKLAATIGSWTASGTNVHRSAGNVGVGLATPVSPVHVHGTGEVRMQITDGASGTTLTDGFMMSLGTTEAAAWVYETRALKFGTNNAERMRIAANGNIGIGTVTPNAPLSFPTTDQNTKIALYDDNSGNLIGLGTGANQFRFHVANSGNRFAFLNAPAGTEVFTIQGAGNVGIGTTNPASTLEVNGYITSRASVDSRIYLRNTASGNTAADGFTVGMHANAGFVWMYEALPLQFATNNAERMHIDVNGLIGINKLPIAGARVAIKFGASDSYGLTIRNAADTIDMFAFTSDGQAYKANGGSWASGSDRRLKTNIEPLSGALERLLALRTVTFDYLDEKWGKGRQNGFIAQEVEPHFPQWVSTNPEGFKMLSFTGFESLTVQALRELRAEKDAQSAALAARIQELEAQNAALQQRLRDADTAAERRFSALEQQVSSLARLVQTAANN
jgi:hypothetical protein